ncbi:SUKH-4 family immunity protein [Streptomyces sp. NPDC052396]|uniref:SUKH-4 family immunity protein n=1 Tax=Streptomyces sp. NPDC052396 TaxID=3365689 RepID=UPI0037D1E19C
MVTFAQAQERAERWINGEVPGYLHREVKVREFDLGFVAWAEGREGVASGDGGRTRLVIARDSGETTLWPGLPVGEVIRRYEEEYGVVDEPAPVAPTAPKRVDLEATSFLLSPPQWLQDAADAMGIPDRRESSAKAPDAASATDVAGTTDVPGTPDVPDMSEGAAVAPAAAPEPAGAGASAGDGAPAADAWSGEAAGPEVKSGPRQPGSAASADAWPDAPAAAPEPVTPAAPPASADSGTGAGRADAWPDAEAGDDAAEPAAWPGAEAPSSAVDDDRSVGLPATVLAPALSGSDADSAPAPGVRPDAKTALLPQGSALPATAIAPALDDPAGGRWPVPGTPGAPGIPGAPAHDAPAAHGAAGAPALPTPPTPPAPPAAPEAANGPAGTATPPPVPGAPVPPPVPGAPVPPPVNAPAAPGGSGAAQNVAYAATMLAHPGGPGAPGAVPPPPGPPGTPGTPSGGVPVPPGTPANPPAVPGGSSGGAQGVAYAATMLAHPGGPGALGTVPPPPGPPGTPQGAAPRPPGPPNAPAAPGGSGGGQGIAQAATMLAPGAAVPGAPVPPPGPAGSPAAPGGYGYPQPPAGVPTVGPGYMAVLRYRAQDGSEQQIIRRSAPGTPHPEWQILHELRALNVPPQQVLELHTELESCDLPGGYCARMVRETWPQVRISHTAAYGRDHAGRQQGMSHLVTHQGELHQVAGAPARPAPNRVPLPRPGQVPAAPPVAPDAIGRELVDSFTEQGVFRFDQRAVSRQGVPEVVAHTLVWAGLPRDFGPFFWAQAQPGRPVPTLAELAVERGVQPAADAASYLVMGGDFGRQLCVQYGTAHIVAVPLEPGPDGRCAPPQFVNTSLPQFVRSLALLGRMWRWRYGLTPEQAGRWTVDFQDQLSALDATALSSPENWWAVLLEQMWDGLF